MRAAAAELRTTGLGDPANPDERPDHLIPRWGPSFVLHRLRAWWICHEGASYLNLTAVPYTSNSAAPAMTWDVAKRTFTTASAPSARASSFIR